MPTSSSGPTSLGLRLYRSALRLLPADFRDQYGGEILAFHRAHLEEVFHSPWKRMLVWCLAILDVLVGAGAERGRELVNALFLRGNRTRGVGPGRGLGGGGRNEKPGWGTHFDALGQDLKYAIRSLARSPGFTSVSVFSLAVGVGLFAGFVAYVQGFWLEPVPGVQEAEGAAELTVVSRGIESESWAYPDFEDLRTWETPFQELAGWMNRDGTLYSGEGSEHVRMMSVSANYFRVLGVTPARGRDFLPSEDAGPGQHPVAVVSYGLWQNRLGGDPGIIGRTLVLNQVPHTVVGVAPEAFTGHRILVEETEVWLPLMQDPWVAGSESWVQDRDARWLRVLGHLRTGTTLEEGNAALETVFSRLENDHPESNLGRRARAYPFGPVPAVGRAESALATLLLAGLLALVLLIVCGNVAGMVLARSVTREREIAVRLSLGSGRGRLARLLLSEALLLSVAAGVSGVFLGVWGMQAAYALLPGAPSLSFPFGWHLLLPMGLLVLGTTLLVGFLPALRFSRPELASSLKEGSGGSGRRAGRIHRFAASAQTGLALSLMVVTGLFVRAVGALGEQDLGFEPEGLLTTRLDLSGLGIQSEEMAEVYLEPVRDAVAAVPGVTSVALADGLPVDLVGNFTSMSRLDRPEDVDGSVQVEFFFPTVGTSILRGRGIEATDDQDSEPVVVLTRSLSERLFPGEDAVGKRVRSATTREGPTEFTVVGIVQDVASSRPSESWPQVFFSMKQSFTPRMMLLVRGPSDPGDLYQPVREALLAADPDLPHPLIVSSEELLYRAADGQRVSARVAGALGVLALLLAAIGVYGVVAFAVSRRTREIGMRMALGASRRTVLVGTLWEGFRLASPGLLVGALLAGGCAAGFRAQLFGLSPVDPASFLGAGAALLAIILSASLVPARRASGIDPMEALRGD